MLRFDQSLTWARNLLNLPSVDHVSHQSLGRRRHELGDHVSAAPDGRERNLALVLFPKRVHGDRFDSQMSCFVCVEASISYPV